MAPDFVPALLAEWSEHSLTLTLGSAAETHYPTMRKLNDVLTCLTNAGVDAPRHGSLCINLDETYLMSLNSASAPLRMDSFVDGVSIERRSFVDAMSLFVMSFFVIATTINAPWFFNRLRRYISSVLTYLLTYLLTYE